MADSVDSPDEELRLVAALKVGDAVAYATFEARYLAPLPHLLGSVRLDAADLDEVKQRTREKLLVPDSSGAMRIEGYAGKGRLKGLVRVVATREAISLRRRTRREVGLPEDVDGVAEAPRGWDPGIAMLEGRTKAAFVSAFEEAVRGLTTRERTLLRLHLLGGVTLEKLGEMYGVHRATIVRWIAAARERLLEETRRRLGGALGLDASELESVMEAVRASLDLSVERLFASVEAGTD